MDNVIVFTGRLHKTFLIIASLVALSIYSASASAFIEPGFTGAWADFSNCPVRVILVLGGSRGATCEHSYTTGGVVQIGHSVAPISMPGDTLDLGATALENHGSTIAPAHGLLNGPAQPVPGGVLGSVGNTQLTGVSTKLEWAAAVPPDTAFGFTENCKGTDPFVTFDSCRVLTGKPGPTVTLSVKIHLVSPFLGSNCYIGSATAPIVIALTAGITSPPSPTIPIHGTPVAFLLEPANNYMQAIGIRLVNNSFGVPVATGCGTAGGNLVNASIDHKLGLPSPPGQNMFAITADAEQAPAQSVLENGWTGE